MQKTFDMSDVPQVSPSDFDFVIQFLVDSGQGLALLRGMHESEIRAVEDSIWTEFQGSSDIRLAVALRFRALLGVFSGRRLKILFLERGYRLLEAAGREAAEMPLNIRFGFNAQRLLLALDAMTARPIGVTEADYVALAA